MAHSALQRVGGLVVAIGCTLGFTMPTQAQVSEPQVAALVEALRRAAPQTATPNDGYYSQWQIKPENIPRWSKSCIGKSLSPEQFEADSATARTVVTCVMRDVLRDEYRAGGNNELIAVRRAAAWWMTGDPARYTSSNIQPYIQKVVGFYQQSQPTAAKPPASSPSSSQSSTPPPSSQGSSTNQTSLYDRYMRAGYAANQKNDRATALLYFKRALDERPNDSYAQQAISNVERYIQHNGKTSSQP